MRQRIVTSFGLIEIFGVGGFALLSIGVGFLFSWPAACVVDGAILLAFATWGAVKHGLSDNPTGR